MRSIDRRLERLEAASMTVPLARLLYASEDEQRRILVSLSDAELDRLLNELKTDEEGVAI